ncbi:hypothetical protein IF1G_01200 [Cordyceps javanica]|uniref:Uncharacterized protein n=1 Tax=Cordyceps javanica TaxID=43265 RepID=A0A545VHR3_9HYPO|nr:hypothetical protein IF1G_01200 [Cordyceps javanica]
MPGFATPYSSSPAFSMPLSVYRCPYEGWVSMEVDVLISLPTCGLLTQVPPAPEIQTSLILVCAQRHTNPKALAKDGNLPIPHHGQGQSRSGVVKLPGCWVHSHDPGSSCVCLHRQQVAYLRSRWQYYGVPRTLRQRLWSPCSRATFTISTPY